MKRNEKRNIFNMAALCCLQTACVSKMGKRLHKSAKKSEAACLLHTFCCGTYATAHPPSHHSASRFYFRLSLPLRVLLLLSFCMLEFCPFFERVSFVIFFFAATLNYCSLCFCSILLTTVILFSTFCFACSAYVHMAMAASECRYTFMRKGNWLHFCKYLSEG